MTVEKTSIDKLLILRLKKFEDERGSFFETYNQDNVGKITGFGAKFVQDNYSISHKNVIRGLHFQTGDHAQGKLVQVLNGVVMDVVVDLREGSPTFGQHETFILSGGDNKMIWIPSGFAHGFKSMVDNTHFSYKCTSTYNKEKKGGIIYNEPDLNIN